MEKQELVQVCKDCGNEFTITVSEQNFYESRELALPKRCETCRKVRKMVTNSEKVEEKPKKSLDEMMKEAGIN